MTDSVPGLNEATVADIRRVLAEHWKRSKLPPQATAADRPGSSSKWPPTTDAAAAAVWTSVGDSRLAFLDPTGPLWKLLDRAARRYAGSEQHGANNGNAFVYTRAGLITVRTKAEQAAAGTAGGPRLHPTAWDRESDVVAAAGRVLPFVPEVLEVRGGVAVYRFLQGSPIPERQPLGVHRARAFGQMLGLIGNVRRSQLPPLPDGWPPEGDSAAYATFLLDRAQEVWDYRRPIFGDVYAAFGFGDQPIEPFRESARGLTDRASGLLHNDQHPGNVLEKPFGVLDWELASLGDPVSDLAGQLLQMRYSPQEGWAAVAGWEETAHPEARRGARRDLPKWRDIQAGRMSLGVVSGPASAVREAYLLAPGTARESVRIAAATAVARREAPRVLAFVNRVNQTYWDAPRPLRARDVVGILLDFARTSSAPESSAAVLATLPRLTGKVVTNGQRSDGRSPTGSRMPPHFARMKQLPKDLKPSASLG